MKEGINDRVDNVMDSSHIPWLWHILALKVAICSSANIYMGIT